MTKEERAERSRLRAEEYQRRKRTRTLLVLAALALYVVVPLLWNGAVEFGWVNPIRTPELQNSLRLAGIVLSCFVLFNVGDILNDASKQRKRSRDEQPKAVNPA